MPQDLRVAIRLDADAKGFRGEMRLGAKALAQLTGSTDRASAASRRRFIPARAGNTRSHGGWRC